MNKIIVEISIGELLDKISILEIKQEKIKDINKLKFISNEHSILKNQLDNNVKTDNKLSKLFELRLSVQHNSVTPSRPSIAADAGVRK